MALGENQPFVVTKLEEFTAWAQSSAIWPMTMGLACCAIEMMSIAMENPQEIRDFARRCPDVQISEDPKDPNYGIPVARNRKAKVQALKAAGYQEINSERVRR